MKALWCAALVASAITVVLNAHAGFVSAKLIHFGVLFAVLNAALDVAKCSLLVAARNARLSGAYGLALVCWLFFPWLFVNSVWNAVSQVAVTRDEGKADKVGAGQTRTRTDAEYQRLTRELGIMQANPTFNATAACTLPKSKDARAFCDAVRAAQSALATASTQLSATPPNDPEPVVSWVSTMLGVTAEPIQFTAAMVPVLLAEVLGSLGFYISDRITFGASGRPVERSSSWGLGRWRRTRENVPTASPGASVTPAQPGLSGVTKPPAFKLPIPRAPAPANPAS